MNNFEFIQALFCNAVKHPNADRRPGLSLNRFYPCSINRKGSQTLLDPPDDPTELPALALKACSQVGLEGQFVTPKADLLGTPFHCKRTMHKLWRDHLSRQHVWAMPRPRHRKHVFCSETKQKTLGIAIDFQIVARKNIKKAQPIIAKHSCKKLNLHQQ